MFINLISVMRLENMGIEDLAKILGVHRNTVTSKLDGTSELTFDQVEKIRTLFKKYNYDWLFSREQSPA